MIELMISARLLLILHKYAGIYMGASAQCGRTLASEKFGTGLPGWSGLGWLGQSWPRAAGQSQGPLSGHTAQTNSAPSSVRTERRLKIPRMKNLVKTQRVKLQMHQHFFFLLFFLFYYIEILALILMNLRDFPTLLYAKYLETRENANIFLVLQFLQMIVENDCREFFFF